MNDKQFDNILKNKLSGFESQSTPDWELFAQKKQIVDASLDQEANLEDLAFDAEINASLHDFKTQIHAPQWDAFKAKKTELQDQIEQENIDQDFDNQVKAELDSYQPEVTPQWASFQKEYQAHKDALQPEVVDDGSFDQDVKAQLEDYQMNVTPQWDAFKDLKAKADGEVKELNQHKDFDEAIRAGVIAIALPDVTTRVEPNWGAFKSKMDQVDHFDETVKETVEDYQSDHTPDWEAFREKQIESDSFDQEIEETLSDHQSTQAPDWNKFLDKKRAADTAVADASFDKGVTGAVNKVSTRYNSQHWQLLRDRLRRIAALKKNIVSYKGLEIAFVMLMLLTFGNHFGPLMDKLVTSENVEFAQNKVEVNNNSATAPVVKSDDKTTAQKEETVIASSANNTDATNKAKSNTEVATSNVNNSTTFSNDGPRTPIANKNKTTTNQSNNPALASVVGDANEEKSNASTPSATQEAKPVIQPSAISRALIAGLETLADNKVAQLYTERTLPGVAETKFIDDEVKKKYKDEGSWVHLYAAIENNYIHTPNNPDAGLDPTVNDQSGYSFEAICSRVKGSMEYEAGLGYNFVDYKPYGPGVIGYEDEFSFREIRFNKIKLDMVALPLRAKYHFISNGRWSVFGSAGVNLELIAQTKYLIQDDIINPIPIDITQPPPPPGFDLPWFYKREFTSGLLGDVPMPSQYVNLKSKSNIFTLRGTLGIGAERNISDNLSAYMRADYYHTLYNTEIGPYNDKINKAALGMGFKLRIK